MDSDDENQKHVLEEEHEKKNEKVDDNEVNTKKKKEKKKKVQEGEEEGKKIKGKKKPGVVYISRPPMYMKPEKVRFLLGQYGKITNLYLQPEDENLRSRRVQSGGSKKIKYREGWIEFEDRKVAKTIAISLNGQIVGGKRRSFQYDDLWTLKYLPGFKWTHLQERNAYEKRTRNARLRTELVQSKRENEMYLEKLQQEKQISGMIKRKQETLPETSSEKPSYSAKRSFKQLANRDEYTKSKKKANKGDAWLENVFM